MSKVLSMAQGDTLKLIRGGESRPGKASPAKISDTDKEMIKRITPIIEKSIERKITAHVIETLIDTLEQQNYPPEENIRPDFIEEVKKAEKGKFKKFKNPEEFRKYMARL